MGADASYLAGYLVIAALGSLPLIIVSLLVGLVSRDQMTVAIAAFALLFKRLSRDN